jgi:hypothetical protein
MKFSLLTCIRRSTGGKIYVGYSKINLPLVGKEKYKMENKAVLYGTVTYITALLPHTVAIHIKALVLS